MSRATLLKKLNAVRAPNRVNSVQIQATALTTRDEILTISSALMKTILGTGKHTLNVEKVIDSLRDNGLILARGADQDTGKFVPLSTSTIILALCQSSSCTSSVTCASAAQQLASLHPNHVC
ncbi:MAG: hypothetical protein ACSLEN_14275 [Candidatus Malihini olakiniferum]